MTVSPRDLAAFLVFTEKFPPQSMTQPLGSSAGPPGALRSGSRSKPHSARHKTVAASGRGFPFQGRWEVKVCRYFKINAFKNTTKSCLTKSTPLFKYTSTQ